MKTVLKIKKLTVNRNDRHIHTDNHKPIREVIMKNVQSTVGIHKEKLLYREELSVKKGQSPQLTQLISYGRIEDLEMGWRGEN